MGSVYHHSRHKDRRLSRTPQTGGGTSSLSVCQLITQEKVLQITFRFKSARAELGKKVFVHSFHVPFAWDLLKKDWKQTDLMSTLKFRPRVLQADSTSLNWMIFNFVLYLLLPILAGTSLRKIFFPLSTKFLLV